MTLVYASTQCLRETADLLTRVRAYQEAGIPGVELGAGVTITPDFLRRLPAGDYLIHNYFPPPSTPFVQNLASANAEILTPGRRLARGAVDLSASLGAPFYSVHAGFVEDPRLEQGRLVFPSGAATKDATARSLDRFVQEIADLAAYGAARGVMILVENNVCPRDLVGQLLLQETSQFEAFFAALDTRSTQNVGILADLGHLNVSATTLGFDRMEFLLRLAPRVRGFHVHDNDGSADQHRPWSTSPWIREVLSMSCFASAPRVLESRCTDLGQVRFEALALDEVMVHE